MHLQDEFEACGDAHTCALWQRHDSLAGNLSYGFTIFPHALARTHKAWLALTVRTFVIHRLHLLGIAQALNPRTSIGVNDYPDHVMHNGFIAGQHLIPGQVMILLHIIEGVSEATMLIVLRKDAALTFGNEVRRRQAMGCV